MCGVLGILNKEVLIEKLILKQNNSLEVTWNLYAWNTVAITTIMKGLAAFSTGIITLK